MCVLYWDQYYITYYHQYIIKFSLTGIWWQMCECYKNDNVQCYYTHVFFNMHKRLIWIQRLISISSFIYLQVRYSRTFFRFNVSSSTLFRSSSGSMWWISSFRAKLASNDSPVNLSRITDTSLSNWDNGTLSRYCLWRGLFFNSSATRDTPEWKSHSYSYYYNQTSNIKSFI